MEGRGAEIVGGVRETGEPAAVVVKAFSGVGLCTGTLISDRVILTAKHCVQAPGADRPYPASTIEVGFGDQAATTTDVRAVAVATTPGVYTSSPTTGLGGALVGVDVAVITLRSPIADVTPIAVGRDAPATFTAGEFTAIGFGQTETGAAGTKYKTTGTVLSVSGNVLYTRNTICQGDSGGPMIIESPVRRVVGVASFGEAEACPSSQDGYNSIQAFLGLIDGAVIASGGCPSMGAETCNSVDDDCDGEIDEDCARPGEPCDVDADCAFAQLPDHFEPLDRPAFCGDAPAGRICTRRCDPMTPAAGCDVVDHPFLETTESVSGMYCANDGACMGLCVPGIAGSARGGATCDADADCATLLCADPGDGRRQCASPCRGGEGLCPATEVCAAPAGECGACLAAGAVSGARGLGEPCGAASDCASGMCLEDGDFSYCSVPCADDAECADGFHCRAGSCVRGPRSQTGDPCLDTADCVEGDVCEAGALRWCTHACVTGTACPMGFLCNDDRCAPARRLIGQRCEGTDECIASECLETGDGRRCTRACGPGMACRTGLECRRVGHGAETLCGPELEPEGGCCAIVGARPAPRGLLPVLALIFVAARLRRRRATAAARR